MTSTTPIIILEGLEGNTPQQPSETQQFLLPYEPFLEQAFLALWVCMLVTLVTHYILLPLIERYLSQR